MKETKFKCDHCEKLYANDAELITLGTEGGQDIFYINPDPQLNQVKELNRMHDLHFCSQHCFTHFFFDTENMSRGEKFDTPNVQ